MSDRVAAAHAALVGAGCDPAAAEQTPPVVDPWRSALSSPAALTVIAALGDLSSPAAATLLAALEPLAPTPPLRRAVRRALFLMQQRGVAPPLRAATPIAVVAQRPPHLAGYLSGFDGRGDRIGWLIHAPPGDATTLVIAVLNEPEGLRHVRATTVTRKELRSTRERFTADHRMPLVAVDGAVLDALLVEAHDRLAERERTQDYRRLRQKFTTLPAAPAMEPRSTKVDPPPADLALAALPRSAELLTEPELSSWWPPAAQLAPYIAQVRDLRDSPIVLAPGQQEQRLRVIVDHAARELFPIPVLARRLAGTAYVLAETGRTTAATLALAVVHALETAPATADVPLATALVHRALGTTLAVEERTHTTERADSLVVTPSEALRERAPSRPPHTQG